MAIDYCSAQEGYEMMGVKYPGEKDPVYSFDKHIGAQKREVEENL